MLILSPMFVMVTKRKKFILNINNYRNTHYQALNRAKINYLNEVGWQVKKLPVYTKKCRGIFTLYPARLCDVDNVLSIHSKFLLDTLVKFGKIKDDNYKFYTKSTFQMGKVDKQNPRVEVEFMEEE